MLTPGFDGNPRNPPRFRQRPKKVDREPASFGQSATFGNPPASGAGATGFDSANGGARKARPPVQPQSGSVSPSRAQESKAAGRPGTKPAQTTKPGAVAKDAKGQSGADTKFDPAQPPATAAADPATSPRLLQPAVGPLSGRLRQFRPGAPPSGPDVETATVATTPPLWRPFPEPKPFDPLGIQVGALNFRPAFEYARGYDTNPARLGLPPISGSWVNLYAAELAANSNWARHELTVNLRGSFATFDTAHQLDRPTADGRINGRIDVTSLTHVDLEGRFILGTDKPGSPNIQADLAHFPIYTTLGASAGIGQRFNRFEVTLKGGVDRTEFAKSVFVDGETESNRDRNYDQYSTAIRAAYDLSPGVRPFAEAAVNKRVHELPVDRFALDRDSTGYTAKAGMSFDLARTLTGEFALGYLNQVYLAPLSNLGGYSVESSLAWSVTALTTAKLLASTTTYESPLLLVSGVLTRLVGVEVNHAFRRWLIGTARFGLARDTYGGGIRRDDRYFASAALSYLLTREFQLKGEMRQEWDRSNIPGANYVASVWLLGLRLAR